MAMTAWLANVATSSICLSVNGRTSRRWITMRPITTASFSIGTKAALRTPSSSTDATRDGSRS